MTETKEHRFLKEIGMAYLFNQNCFLVATEVNIKCRERIHTLDRGFFVDVCGVGEKYIPWTPWRKEQFGDKYKYNVLRAIEVKVSRSDFKHGFICSGCNYHYLITPKGLVKPEEVPKGVGFITVDINNFHSKFYPSPTFRFAFEGVTIVRKPKFWTIKQWQIDNAISSIAKRSTRDLIRRVAERLSLY